LLLTNSYLTQRHRMTDAIKSEDGTSHKDMLIEINGAMSNEPQRIAKSLEQAYTDAIRMGVNQGLQQIGSTITIGNEVIEKIAFQEALRFGTKISQQTQQDFSHIMQKFTKANYNELIQRVYTPARIQDVIVPEVNRLFNLGIQLAGRQSNIQKMKWIAECPVCEQRNNKTSSILSDVIPSLHKTCKCIIELVKE
jgi:hypothetical protein